jgi:hypothetical protein
VLAQRGEEAEAAARKNLNATYRRFMAEADPGRMGVARKEPIRSIFGKDAIAEDPISSLPRPVWGRILAWVEERQRSLPVTVTG